MDKTIRRGLLKLRRQVYKKMEELGLNEEYREDAGRNPADYQPRHPDNN